MIKVLMLGTSRKTKGGITTVVNNYYKSGLDKKIKLKYIETVNDKFFIIKLLKMFKGFVLFIFNIFKYDIVHIHMASRWSTYRKSIYVYISKFLNKKVILHMHGGEFNVFYSKECGKFKKKYIINFINKCDKIIVLSKEWESFFSTLVDNKKIVILYNSLIVPRDFNKDLNSKKFLFLGILGKRKGIYDLIDVFEYFLNVDDSLILYIGGNGKINSVNNLIKRKGLDKNIKILGWVSGKKKEKLLKECSYYILPSYNEAMPLSVIEGMAYKNVTISTNVGGIPQIINNNYNGVMISPGNKVELYNVILKLLNDEKLRKKLSNNGYKTIREKFNVNENIKDLINIYNCLKK